MSYVLNSHNSNRSLNENPLITVTGDLSEFILSNLSTQITSDLGRESIDWHRSYDQPITVYLEANFVELDERKHFLNNYLRSDVFSKNSATATATTTNGKSHLNHHHQNNNNANSSASYSAHSGQIPSQSTQPAPPPTRSNQTAVAATTNSLKRHNSFNVIRQFSFRGNNHNNNNTQDNSGGGGLPATASGGASSTTSSGGGGGGNYYGDSGHFGGEFSSLLDDCCQQVNTRLYWLIAKRYQLTNGSRILLNSYWLDAGPDLESYSQSVRDSLFDWFGKMLSNAAYQCRIGFSSEFTLDCFIVILIRDIYPKPFSSSSDSHHHHSRQSSSSSPNSNLNNNNSNTSSKINQNNNNNNKSCEQVLSLEKLVVENQNPKNSFSVFKSNKFLRNTSSATNNSGSSHPHHQSRDHHLNNNSSTNSLPLTSASSLSHLNSSSSSTLAAHSSTVSGAQISYAKLVEQIRNYLLVSFQLFQQECHQNNSGGGGGGDGGGDNQFFQFASQLNAQQITSQLMERILIFDYTSNSCQNLSNSNNTTSSSSSSFSSSANLAGSASNLSNFSNSSNNHHNSSAAASSSGGGLTNPILSSTAKTFSAISSSIKIQSSSMSPSKSKGTFSGKHGGKSGSGSGVGQPTIHNYSSFVTRLRTMLLDVYSRQFDSYEKLIRRQRELRNKPEWDFLGFFLLQEELSFAYENLGMYQKAMIQYDELDALFSQSILNTSTAGIGPQWLQRRLIGPNKEDSGGGGGGGGGQQQQRYSPLYNAWNGLCLCNPEAINSLRYKIVECVLYDSNARGSMSESDEDDDHHHETSHSGYDSMDCDDSGTRFMSDLEPVSSPGSRSITSENVFEFNDPLGVNHVSKPSRPPRTSHHHSQHHHHHHHQRQHRRSLSSSAQSCQSWTSSTEQISLIDFRNYLFARQCHLLCLLNKPWELASRALPFLQTCVYELNLLEIMIAPGGIACWVFLSVLEILHKCERYSDSSQLESYSYHTVGLWSYARDKLAELGRLCNLMPGSIDSKLNSSEHLHRMVELVAGMGTDPHIRSTNAAENELWLSPQERLKDALSSSEAFLKHFLELTELTMGTYKHIGYIRSARLIGKELAELYLKLDKPQQALPFLLDLYNMFQTESWNFPKFEASQLLAQCLEQLYLSAYRRKDSTMNETSSDTVPEEGAQPVSDPAFNLEATARSAFRTYLLLFLQCCSQSIRQLSQTSLSSGTSSVISQKLPIESFYLVSLRSLLKSYSDNGLRLVEIFEKLDFHSCPTIPTVCPQLSFQRPLLTIHNSQSDFNFYHHSFSSAASSNTNLNSSKTKLNNSSDDSNLNSAGRCNGSSSGSVAGGSSGGGGCGNSRSGIFPLERFVRIQNAEISCENVLRQQQKDSSLAVGSGSGVSKDGSFIAGSMLRLKISIISELTLDLEVKHLMATLECQNIATSGDRIRHKSSDFSGYFSSTSDLSTNSGPTIRYAASNFDQENSVHRPAAAIMQIYNENQLVGIKCMNGPQVLKRFDHWASGGGGGGVSGKFLPQIPVSLLNQRLADDQNNFKNYRFFSSKYRFDLASPDLLKLKPGLNEYQLFFQTPEQLNNINCSNNNQINEIRFHFDQLVFLCCLPTSSSSSSDKNLTSAISTDIEQCFFALVEDFCSNVSFRLVKCPPKVELIPFDLNEIDNNNANEDKMINEDDHDDAQRAVITNKMAKKATFPNLLIGIDRPVILRLNSGTNILPNGLKCFVKITPIVGSGGAATTTIGHNRSNVASVPVDYRSVNASLHQLSGHELKPVRTTNQSSNDYDDDSLLYFYLDRQIEPFESFELKLKLKSSYSRTQICTIKKFQSISGGVGGAFNNRNNFPPNYQSRDFLLTISWSHLDSNSYTINSSCCFSLYEPFQVVAQLYTSLERKFIQIGLRGADQLPPDCPIHLSCPRLSSFQPEKIDIITSNGYDETTTTTNRLKPLSFGLVNCDNGNRYPFSLLPTRELYFVWQIIRPNDSQMDELDDNSILKRVLLELNYCSESSLNKADEQEEEEVDLKKKKIALNDSPNKVLYDIRIAFDYNTRYVIREQIEPMPGMKNSELLRIGNSCMLRASIERCAFDLNDEESPEYVMYELVCDPELWSMVSSYRSFAPQQQQQQHDHPTTESSMSSLNSDNSGAVSGGGGGSSNASLNPHDSSAHQSMVTVCCDNIVSKVIKLTKHEPIFESTFEVMPLTSGYIPLPSIRLSRYIPSQFNSNSSPSGSSTSDSQLNSSPKPPPPPPPLPTIDDPSDQSSQPNQPPSSNSSGPLSNTIESLSAKLSENLSLTSKNWSKFINHLPSSSSSTSGHHAGGSSSNSWSSNTVANRTTNNPESTNSSTNSSAAAAAKTSKLVAFEPGQVYNYSRASQIYVLPSTGPVIAEF